MTAAPIAEPPPARPQAVTAPAKPSKPRASDTLDWSHLAHELDLDGMTRQIVTNSIVINYDEKTLNLALPSELESLLKSETKSKIKAALDTTLGVSLSLEFEGRSALEVETPHEAAEREAAEARAEAIESIRQQPAVKQLSELFDAQLIEASVKPLADQSDKT